MTTWACKETITVSDKCLFCKHFRQGYGQIHFKHTKLLKLFYLERLLNKLCVSVCLSVYLSLSVIMRFISIILFRNTSYKIWSCGVNLNNYNILLLMVIFILVKSFSKIRENLSFWLIIINRFTDLFYWCYHSCFKNICPALLLKGGEKEISRWVTISGREGTLSYFLVPKVLYQCFLIRWLNFGEFYLILIVWFT